MDTYFASAARAGAEEIRRDIELAGRNPVITGLLRAASGLLAVLNENRQILVINDSFLEVLGIDDAQEVIGLRPGEAIQCIHAHEMPGGCGTSKFCASCGAAIAIVSCLCTDQPVERKCIATVIRNNKTTDLCMMVRACRILFEGRPLILLFLQDSTAAQRWAAIERIFFHDICNLITGLKGAAEVMLLGDKTDPGMLDSILRLSSRLAREVSAQRALVNEDLADYRIEPRKIPVTDIVRELQTLFNDHPIAKGKRFTVPQMFPVESILTDKSLLLRVLSNMVTNALEATEEGGEVRFWIEQTADWVRFCVRNSGVIPSPLTLRVFQRNFTTKQEPGRGLGTYAMKLFGEQFLGGKVDFVSSEPEGTVFRLSLPA